MSLFPHQASRPTFAHGEVDRDKYECMRGNQVLPKPHSAKKSPKIPDSLTVMRTEDSVILNECQSRLSSSCMANSRHGQAGIDSPYNQCIEDYVRP